MHFSELPNFQLTTGPRHRPRLRRRTSCSFCGPWLMLFERVPRLVTASGLIRSVPMRCGCTSADPSWYCLMERFLEFSAAPLMRNLRRDNASLCPQYSLSKHHHFLVGPDYRCPSSAACLELIGSDSFSCMVLQKEVDAGLRTQHIRLLSDVRLFPSLSSPPRCRQDVCRYCV